MLGDVRCAMLVVVLLACSADSRRRGSAECAAFDEACPSDCSNARERGYDSAAKCWRSMRVACTKTPPIGFSAAVGCCIRADGLIFRNSMGGRCLYTEPNFIGYRDCTATDTSGTSAADCP